ncbi:MAG TPA: serine hydrolase domain-containing protein [Burkholderiales bacterium]|jgi:CubicO group peptidase (beta-lactamase class C family)
MTSGVAQALSLLDAWTAHSFMEQHLPSVALTVVQGDGPVWTRAFGFADVGAKTAATPQTLYRIGSITKTFTALAILQLREGGKLRLDDRVRDHLTTTASEARRAGLLDVTIRELLTHSSGLQRDLPGTWWSRPGFPAQFPDQFRATYPPGTEWKYSNTGYALLGEVIAAAGGDPWARHVERRILAPLGMAGTGAGPRREGARPATGYSRPGPGEPHGPAQHADHGVVGPAAGMVSTIEDMGRWLAFHMGSGGSVLGGKSLREMHRPQWLLDDWQTAWGLGMRVRRVDGRVRVGHPGSTPGFAGLIEFIPALKLGVAVLTNADDGNPAGYCDYALQLLAPIVAKAAARAAPAFVEDAERYCGLYRSENGHMTVFVAALDGQLALVPPGAPNPYAARAILERTTGLHTFIVRSSGAFSTLPFGERLTFSTSASGEITGYDIASSARFVRRLGA